MKALLPLAVKISLLLYSQPLFFESPALKEEGTVVSRLNRVLVVIDKDQQTTRQYEIAAEVPIMLNGKPAKLEELQAGDVVVMTLNDAKTVTAIDATSGKRKVEVLRSEVALDAANFSYFIPYF